MVFSPPGPLAVRRARAAQHREATAAMATIQAERAARRQTAQTIARIAGAPVRKSGPKRDARGRFVKVGA